MSATRKTLAIMIGIIAIEGLFLFLSLHRATQARIAALYDPLTAGWPACLLAAAVATVFILHAIRGFPLIATRFFDASALKLLALPFALITGSMEELWFRRAAMNAVADRGGGALLQIVVSAIAFGLVHAVWGIFAGKWRVAAGSMIATGGLGAALAIVYLVGGREVAPCMCAHIAINLAIEPWLLLAAVSGAWRPRA